MVGTRLGTSYTMAPEQIRGDAIDERADIYALGVVLYHLLTGQYPFRAETMADIERQHLEAPPPRPSHVAPLSPALDAVVLRSMEKVADRRFPTARAFWEALREAVGSTKADVPEVSAQAAAIYVEVRMSPEADNDSDELLDDSSAALDAAEQAFRDAGLVLALQTGSALIAARILSDDAAQAARERAGVKEIAEQARRTAGRTPDGAPRGPRQRLPPRRSRRRARRRRRPRWPRDHRRRDRVDRQLGAARERERRLPDPRRPRLIGLRGLGLRASDFGLRTSDFWPWPSGGPRSEAS